MPLLRLVFIAQLLVMLTGFVSILLTPAEFQTVAVMFYLAIVGFIVLLYAAWQFIRHPDRRALAAATIVTPLVCLTSPFLIVRLTGGPIEPGTITAAVLAVVAVAAVMFLSKKAHWQAGGRFADSRLNKTILISLAVMLVLYWTPVVAWLYPQESIRLPTTISERDQVLRIAAVWFITIAGPACIASLLTLLYAPVGLIRNSGGRLLHAGQLILSLLTLASLAIGALFVAIAMVNPG